MERNGPLASEFLRSLRPGPVREAWAALPALEEALHALWGRARALWPEVALPAAAFVRHVAARWPERDPPDPAFKTLNGVDLYLLGAYLEGLPAAARVLEQRYLSRVPELLHAVGMSAAQREEVRDEVREKLLLPRSDGSPPAIGAYAGYGTLLEWLRVVSVRTALHLLDRVEHRRRSGDEDALERIGQDPELRYVKALDKAVLSEALRAAFAEATGQQRTLLRMYYLDELTVEEIGKALGVNKSTVSRRLQAAQQSLARTTRRLLAARLRLSPAEADSLAGFVQSQLGLSLAGILRETKGP